MRAIMSYDCTLARAAPHAHLVHLSRVDRVGPDVESSKSPPLPADDRTQVAHRRTTRRRQCDVARRREWRPRLDGALARPRGPPCSREVAALEPCSPWGRPRPPRGVCDRTRVGGRVRAIPWYPV